MESIISTFHIDWKIIIAQAINFAVVFVVLYIFALKPLGRLMSERSGKIAKGMDDAKENAVVLERSKKEYDEAIARAKNEANKIFDAGKKEAEAKRAQMMDEAKGEVSALVQGGKKTLEAEKVKMMEDAKREIAEVAMKAAEKILGDSRGFNEKALKELSNL